MPALWIGHHRKNACPLFIVKSEFQGYNGQYAGLGRDIGQYAGLGRDIGQCPALGREIDSTEIQYHLAYMIMSISHPWPRGVILFQFHMTRDPKSFNLRHVSQSSWVTFLSYSTPATPLLTRRQDYGLRIDPFTLARSCMIARNLIPTCKNGEGQILSSSSFNPWGCGSVTLTR